MPITIDDPELEQFIRELADEKEVDDVEAIAVEAFEQFGKGRHPALSTSATA